MENCFRVFALGEEFDVDAFISTSQLTPTLIWRRGEPKKPGSRSLYPTSGVAYDLGEGSTIPFLKQEAIALSFLKANRDELKSLGEFPGVTHFTLGLQYSKEARRNLVGFCISASSRLMWHLLDIGCTLTNYVWLEYPDTESNT